MLHNIYVRFQAWLIRRFLRLPRTAAVAPSPFVAAPFHDSPSVHVISDWVSPEFLAAPASPAALRRALAIGDSSPIILIPGRFSPKKGQLLALEASRLLADLPCHVVFSGAPLFEEEGKGVEATLREAARLQPQRIHVIPWREPLPSLYDGADIVLIPSVWEEPFGLVALEAMARERPLIVSNRGMLPELVGGGQFADIVPPAAGAIAAALRNFLQDRPRWMERARRAREHVRSTFNPTVLQGQIFGLFQQLISV
jgi:glycosyltransferase involved in cell wall biosynthesis